MGPEAYPDAADVREDMQEGRQDWLWGWGAAYVEGFAKRQPA